MEEYLDTPYDELDWDYYWDSEQVSKEKYDNLLEEACRELDMVKPGYLEDSTDTQYRYSQILNRIRFY